MHPRLDPRLVYVYELYKSQYTSAIRTGNQSQNFMFLFEPHELITLQLKKIINDKTTIRDWRIREDH